MSEEAKPSTGECMQCGRTLPISKLTWYTSEGGYYPDGLYCGQCLPSVSEEEDQLDWLDELETDVDDDD